MLSAIVLTKNSQNTLRACLDALSFADEIIVADDSSTDQTRTIAQAYSATILSLTPTASFSAKRNQALHQATHDWVLFIDADEVVSPTLHDSILEAIQKNTDVVGYVIKRDDVFMGKKLQFGETGNTWLLRLGKTGHGEWKRTVHEYWDVHGATKKLSGELIHTAHPSIESFIEKINRYSELEVTERVQSSRWSARTQTILCLQLFFYPMAKFIQNYIVRLGCFDGFPGFVMAWMMSLHSLCVRIKLLEHYRGSESNS